MIFAELTVDRVLRRELWHTVDESVTTSSGESTVLRILLLMVMINIAELASEKLL